MCNGYELTSGAVRNHDPELMLKAFAVAGYGPEVVAEKFPALYHAFQFGAPPHAGAAPGLDRILMLLADETLIRDVIAFPMTNGGQDLLMGAPGEVAPQQLRDLHITLDLPDRTDPATHRPGAGGVTSDLRWVRSEGSPRMAHDLVIKGGTVVDGTGAPARRADVAVDGDRITAVGEVDAGGAGRVIDAEGRHVTPGFVDLHSHLDAQIGWDPLMSSSCWHGVTSVVMGNCGMTFAPVRPAQAEVLAGADGVGRGHPRLVASSTACRGTGSPTATTWTPSTRCPRASTPAATSATSPCAPYVAGDAACERGLRA